MIFSFEQFFNPLLENSVVFETKSFQSMIISIVTFYRIYILQRDVKSQLINRKSVYDFRTFVESR